MTVTTQNRWSPVFFLRLAGLAVALSFALTGCRPAPEGPAKLTKPLLTLDGFKQAANSVAYSPDGSLLAAADGKAVKVWEAATGQEVVTFEAETRQGLAFSPDSKRLVVATPRDQIRDARTGKPILNLDLDRKGSGILTIAASPDGRWVAIGRSRVVWGPSVNRNKDLPESFPEMVPKRTEIGTIEVFDAGTGASVRTMDVGDKPAVSSVAFSVDGSRLAAVARVDDRDVVRVWEVETGKVALDLAGPTRFLELVTFSPDGALVASVARNFPPPTPMDTKATPPAPKGDVVKALPRKEGEWIPGASRVQVWHATTGQERCLLPGYYDFPRCLAFSPEGRFVALGTREGIVAGVTEASVRVWDVSTQKLVVRLAGFETNGDLWGVAFSPDGTRVAVASGPGDGPGEVKVWDVSASLRP